MDQLPSQVLCVAPPINNCMCTSERVECKQKKVKALQAHTATNKMHIQTYNDFSDKK